MKTQVNLHDLLLALRTSLVWLCFMLSLTTASYWL